MAFAIVLFSTATLLGPCARPIALAGVSLIVLFDIVMPSALKTRMPAALVPKMRLSDTTPPTGFWKGWNARPIAPWNSWNSFSPPVSIGPARPSGTFRPMFSNVLPLMDMPSMPPVPSCCTAAWHVSRNALSTIETFERVRSWYVLISTSEPAKPGMHAVSSNDRPRMRTLSASTSMRDVPVKTTGPASPPADCMASGFVTSRTVSLYLFGSSMRVDPCRAPSTSDWSTGLCAASITYAFGVHCGRAYAAPVLLSTASPAVWLLTEASPTLPWGASASTTTTRGLAKSCNEAYSRPLPPSSAMPPIRFWRV